MAQYFTDFSEYTTGVAPSDFTARWYPAGITPTIETDAGATGGKFLRVTKTAGTPGVYSWDIIDSDVNTADIEILLRYRADTITTPSGGAAFRASGFASTRNGYFNDIGSSDATISRYLSGGYSIIKSSPFAATANTWYYQRSRINGTSIKHKVWSGTIADEPTGAGEWTIEATNSDISGNGWAGVIAFPIGLHDYDILSIGTNGDPALTPSTTPVFRKSSTFDIETTLGTITTATLNGVNVFDHVTSQVGTTVSFAGLATDEITTSGEYTLALGDGTGTENIAVQVNVVGLASFNINKDGADQGSLTDVEFIILTGAAGSRAINQQVTGVTTTVGGDTGTIEITDTALGDGDTITVVQQSPTVGGGAVHTATLGLI